MKNIYAKNHSSSSPASCIAYSSKGHFVVDKSSLLHTKAFEWNFWTLQPVWWYYERNSVSLSINAYICVLAFCSISTSDYKQLLYRCQHQHVGEATKNQRSDTTKPLRPAGEWKESFFNNPSPQLLWRNIKKSYTRIMKAEVLFLNDKTSKDSARDDKVYQR